MKTLELDITFSRDYYSRHFGVSFEPDYFEDIQIRAETDQIIKRQLFKRFSNIGLGDPAPEPIVQLGYDDTLNVTLMFGGELRMGGGISWVEPGFFSSDAVETMKTPDIKNTWPHPQFLEQYNKAIELFPKQSIRPPIVHGILETAMDMRGAAFLEELLLESKNAERLLDVLTETVIATKEFWDIKCYGKKQKGPALGSCSTTMLSAELVRRFFVPRYSRIASYFGDGFLCSCGLSTQNLENFAAVEDARYVRVGWGTDLEAAAKVLKNKHIKAALDVVRAVELSASEFEKDIKHILETLESIDNVSVLLIHAGAETPDENICRIVEIARTFADDRGVELKDTSSCCITRQENS